MSINITELRNNWSEKQRVTGNDPVPRVWKTHMRPSTPNPHIINRLWRTTKLERRERFDLSPLLWLNNMLIITPPTHYF
jgi:hypothetical protein